MLGSLPTPQRTSPAVVVLSTYATAVASAPEPMAPGPRRDRAAGTNSNGPRGGTGSGGGRPGARNGRRSGSPAGGGGRDGRRRSA